MLKAIFILLLIAFFPLTSLVLGVGLAYIVAQYWWVILLIAVLPAVFKVLDKPYKAKKPYFMED